jgi:hypothetical protein
MAKRKPKKPKAGEKGTKKPGGMKQGTLIKKSNIPDELSGIWTTELTTAWNKLDEKQKSFLIEWYTNGFHGTKAYQFAYKVNSEKVARANASRLLAHANVYVIRQAIQKSLKPPLERIHQVYVDAMSAETPIFAGENHVMDQPDHKNRMAGADRLIKFHDLEKPTELNVNHKGKVTLEINLEPLADLLNGIADK